MSDSGYYTPLEDPLVSGNDGPLKVRVSGGKLVITMPIGGLAYCAAEGHRRVWKPYKITDATEFAKDVAEAMQRNNEIGDTPLGRFINRMCLAALNEGSADVESREEQL